MAAETNGFLIDGKVYEVPTLDSLTLDDEELMYDRCRLTREDFMAQEGETKEDVSERFRRQMKHPAFWSVLIQIAYERGNPDAKRGDVKILVSKLDRMDVLSTMGGPAEEPDAAPLESTSEPDAPSPSGSLDSERSTRDSSGISGSGSGNVSDAQVREVVRIGATRSATSSTSDLNTSAGFGPKT